MAEHQLSLSVSAHGSQPLLVDGRPDPLAAQYFNHLLVADAHLHLACPAARIHSLLGASLALQWRLAHPSSL